MHLLQIVRPTCGAAAVLVALLASEAAGQDLTAAIGGRVLDPSGAAVAGAAVVATQAETHAVRRARTGPGGAFAFTALPIGTYTVAVSHAGFRTSFRRDVELHLGDHVTMDFTLEVGDLTEEVTVTAGESRVQTGTSDQSGLISGEQVRELQLNGRSFMTLLELMPGVASDMPDRADPNSNPNLSINGGRSTASNFNIDGTSNMDVIVGSSSLNTFTSVDTIAEVRVITSTFAAEYGKGGFSQVNVVTRGGTRKFRGSAYEFFRHDALDASDYFSHQTLPLKLNNFGGTVGGPLLLPGGYNAGRDRTFFFVAGEFNRISTRGDAVNTRVPTARERQGDFRALGPGRDGAYGTADDPVIDPLTGQGFPDGVIPADRIDANAVRLLGLYPLPNFVGPGTINYTSAAASEQRWREDMIRVDHNFSRGQRMYVRYAQDSAHILNPYGGTGLTSLDTRFPGLNVTRAERPGKNLVANLMTIARPTLLNDFTFSFSSRVISRHPVGDNGARAALGVAIPEIFPGNEGGVIPTFNLGSGYAALNVSRLYLKRLFQFELVDTLTRLAGRHVFKAGALYSYGGNRENPGGSLTNGSFTFTTAGARNPIANALLGRPLSYTEAERSVVTNMRFAMVEAFVQDDFRVTDRLTLNVGVRYSAFINPWERDNVLTNFLPARYDPARAPHIDPVTGRPVPDTGDLLNGIVIAGESSPFGRHVTRNSADLFGPRAGFAWTPSRSRKTAVRGGYGRYYTRPLIGTYLNSAFDNPPFSRSITIQNPLLSDPNEGRLTTPGAPNLTALGTPMRAPTMQQWSLGVQREIVPKGIVNIAYVGSRGSHLMRPFNINNPEPGLAAALGVAINAVRPYRGYGNITERQPTASSIYHSLQVSFNRRMARGLSVGGAYTWAKAIDDASSDRGTGDIPPDSRNPRTERALADFDRRHVFTANYIWHVPGRHRARAARALLGGWQLSGITRIYTGRPLDVVMSQDVAGIGSVQNQRPNIVADTSGPQRVEEWFNRAAFARPADGTFGNMGRNSLRGPGLHKWDLALFKNFTAGPLRMQFRAEAFNAFNWPQFNAVGNSLTVTATGVSPNASNFGVVTDTRDARVLQFALKANF